MKVLANDQVSKIYTHSSALLNAIFDFNFIIWLVELKIMLSYPNNLNKYLWRKTADFITSRKTTTKKLLLNKERKNFKNVWECAEKLSKITKEISYGTWFSFKEARVPRIKKYLSSIVNTVWWIIIELVCIRLLWKWNRHLIAKVKTYFEHSAILFSIRMR